MARIVKYLDADDRYSFRYDCFTDCHMEKCRIELLNGVCL